MSKQVSAGFVIVCPSGILLGHTTGADQWDVPKGDIDGEETALEGAVRELYEETGLAYTETDLTCKYTGDVHRIVKFRDLGMHPYTKRKDLHLFEVRLESDINAMALKCESMVDRGTYRFPELDRFVLSPSVGKHVNENMLNWLRVYMLK